MGFHPQAVDRFREVLSAIDTSGTEWMARAACARQGDPRWWDEPERDVKRDSPETSRARAICRSCPVADECAAVLEPGVRGGMTLREREEGHVKLRLVASKPLKHRRDKAARAAHHVYKAPRQGVYTTFMVRNMTGITAKQLRYWAETGLVVPSIRDSGGRPGVERLYDDADVERLREIVAHLKAGATLGSIRRGAPSRRRYCDRHQAYTRGCSACKERQRAYRAARSAGG